MRPDMFIQINPSLWKAMVQEVESHYESDRHETAVEFYCGTGFFTLPLSRKLKHIDACEENSSAIEFAKTQDRSANIRWVSSKAEHFAIPSEATVAIVDPPRSGIHRKMIDTFLVRNLKKITYVSCDPTSLARDLQLLSSKYRIERLTLLDLFPQTYHMETIALLVPR
jgi:23S rRNA (uracil1939-C5)-methyltransferase